MNGEPVSIPDINLSLPEIEASVDPAASMNKEAMYTPPPPPIPPIPSGVPINANINTQLQGDFNTGPNPGAKSNSPNGTADYADAISDYMDQTSDTWAKDKSKYGKTYSYGSGHKAANFERYYQHPKFKELGFSPYRDNETLYNERSSWWDDYNRMRTQWASLAWEGFKSPFVNERGSAEEMEKGMAVGTSTREGVAAWSINFSLNTAYTMGMMAEMGIENLGLLAIEGVTGGFATPVVGARVLMNYGRLSKIVTGTADMVRSLKSVEAAKGFFNTAKLGEIGKGALNIINPLEHSLKFGKDAVGAVKAGKTLKGFATTVRGFGAFYRDVRAINVAHAEARLEGEMGGNEYEQKLIDDYYATYGEMPNVEEAQKIHDKALSVKTSATLANDATIYLTNKLVFDDLLTGFNPAKAAKKSIEKEGKIQLEKAAAKGWMPGKEAYKGVAKSKGKLAREFMLKSPYLPWTKQYFVGNIGEALQENAQDVISESVQDYYDRVNSHPSKAGFWLSMNALGKATGNQFSHQGLETFLSGFLMGSIAGGAQQAVFQYAPTKIAEKTNILKEEAEVKTRAELEAKEQGFTSEQTKTHVNTALEKAKKIRKEKSATDTESQNTINQVNDLLNQGLAYGEDNADHAASSSLYSEAMKDAQERGDEKAYKDLKNAQQSDHFYQLARKNKSALATDFIEDVLSMEDDDLANAYNVKDSEVGNVRKKLSEFKDNIEKYKARFDKAQEEYPNPADPFAYDPIKNPEAYKDELARYRAHELFMKNMLYATDMYDVIAERMSGISQSLTDSKVISPSIGGKAVSETLARNISILVDQNQMAVEMESLRMEIKNEGESSKGKKAKKTLDLLEAYELSRNYLMEELNDEFKTSRSPEIKKAKSDMVRIAKGVKVKDKASGKQYTVISTSGKKAIIQDASGKTRKANRKDLIAMKESKVAEEELDSIEDALQMMKNSFENYVRHAAKINDGHIFDANLNKAFNEIKDFYYLSRDHSKIVSSINAFNNPEYADRFVEIATEIEKKQQQEKAANLAKAVAEYKVRIDNNKILNEIFDLGLMVNDIASFNEGGDPLFIDVTSGRPISNTSEKYKQAIEIIEKYKGKKTPPVTKTQQTSEPATTPTPTSRISSASTTKELRDSGALDSLVNAYIEFAKKQAKIDGRDVTEEETNPDLIVATEAFRTFLEQNTTAFKIFNSFNKNVVPSKKADSVKKEVKKDPYAVGEKFNLEMDTIEYPNFSENVEVIGNEGVDDNGEYHYVDLQRENGEYLTIDLLSEDASTYKVLPVKKKDDVKTEPTIDPRKDIVMNKLSDKTGKLHISTVSNEGYSEDYEFEIENGKVIKGVFRTTFETENRGVETKNRPVTDPQKEMEDILSRESVYNKYTTFRERIKGRLSDNQILISELASDSSDVKTNTDIEDHISKLDNINNLEDLEAWFIDSKPLRKANVDITRLFTDKRDAKKQELITTFTPQDLTVGNVVLLNNDESWIVDKISDKGVTIKSIDGKTKKMIPQSNIKSEIKMIYKKGMDKVDDIIVENLTPEDKSNSNLNVQTANDEDAKRRALENGAKAESMTKAERRALAKKNKGCK